MQLEQVNANRHQDGAQESATSAFQEDTGAAEPEDQGHCLGTEDQGHHLGNKVREERLGNTRVKSETNQVINLTQERSGTSSGAQQFGK